MSTVAGIFQSRADAERAANNLRSVGITDERINLLTPGTSDEEVEEAEDQDQGQEADQSVRRLRRWGPRRRRRHRLRQYR